MILTDAGPLVAVLGEDEQDHSRCTMALKRLTAPMLTTWPAFTEAMYLVGSAAGWTGQALLWRLVQRGDLDIAESTPAMIERMQTLMEKYRDLPMDLADASLVALAETRGLSRIFTLDAHFRVYQLADGRRLELIPE